MKKHVRSLLNKDFRQLAVLGLFVLWASTTFSIALMEISFVVALVFWVVSFLTPGVKPGEHRMLPRVDWLLWGPLALFFIFVLVSFFTSEYPKQSFRGVLKIAKPLLVFIMAADLFRSDHEQKRFHLAFLITFLIVLVDCSIQYASGKDLLRGFPAQDSSAGLRLVGPFGDFGKMGAYLILAIPLFAMSFFSCLKLPGKRKDSVYALMLAIAGFILLYLTRCRGPVAALALSLFFLFVYKRWFKILGWGLLLSLVILVLAPRSTILHLDSKFKEQSLVERFYLWRRALDVVTAKPFTGTGINTYAKAHMKYDTVQRKNLMPAQRTGVVTRQNPDGSVSFLAGEDISTSDEKQTNIRLGPTDYKLFRDSSGDYYVYNDLLVRGYYAHNGYLQLAAEIGLPGIFFFLSFLIVFFIRALRAAASVRGSPEELSQLGILTGLLAFLLYALADTNLQSPQSLMSFWYLAGVLLARQSRKGDSPLNDARGTVPA